MKLSSTSSPRFLINIYILSFLIFHSLLPSTVSLEYFFFLLCLVLFRTTTSSSVASPLFVRWIPSNAFFLCSPIFLKWLYHISSFLQILLLCYGLLYLFANYISNPRSLIVLLQKSFPDYCIYLSSLRLFDQTLEPYFNVFLIAQL